MKQTPDNSHHQGSALILSIIALSLLMAATFLVVELIITELRINRDMGDATNAFYAADTAVEYVLSDVRKEPTPPVITGTSIAIFNTTMGTYSYATADISFELLIPPVGTATQAIRIISTGNFKDTYRAVEVTQPL